MVTTKRCTTTPVKPQLSLVASPQLTACQLEDYQSWTNLRTSQKSLSLSTLCSDHHAQLRVKCPTPNLYFAIQEIWSTVGPPAHPNGLGFIVLSNINVCSHTPPMFNHRRLLKDTPGFFSPSLRGKTDREWLLDPQYLRSKNRSWYALPFSYEFFTPAYN